MSAPSPRRVGVFIDGQNITIGARYAFSHGNMHPMLLARALAGDDELVEVRYATGIPDPEVNDKGFKAERRRHDLMAMTGVVVLEKALKYRWQWDIRDRDLADPRDRKGEVAQARVKSRNRGQEKGVDVWLALDALTMCARSDLDVVIIATADTDLNMVPMHLRMIEGQQDTVVIQAKILHDGHEIRSNDVYDVTKGIDRSLFDLSRDDFDYGHDLDENEVSDFLSKIMNEIDSSPKGDRR